MRIAFVVFLVLILIGCQTAPAPITAASPTMLPGATPLPTDTATPPATLTPPITPTVSPAELKRRAAPICENAFSALVESGPLAPPFAVMKAQQYLEAPSWELSHQLPHLGSLAAAEAQTLFCISETRTQTGTYTDGSAAHQFFWDVRVVSWPGGKVIRKQSFTGPPPQTKMAAEDDTEGVLPYDQFAAWIFNQVEHPDFLYFADALTTIAVSPNGRLAAFGTALENQTVSRDYQAKIFLFDPSDLQTEMGTSAFLDVLDGHQGMVTSLAFSPDSTILASSGYDRSIKLWDVATGRLIGQAGITETPNFLTFSPDGRNLAVASDLVVALLDVESMQIEQTMVLSAGNNLAFSPDGNLIYASTPFNITVIDATAGSLVLEFPDAQALLPTVVAAPDGSVLGVTYETPNTVDDFVLSPDGTQIISFTEDRSVDSSSGTENVRLATWDAGSGKYLRETRFAGESVQAIALSPSGELLALGNNNEVWVWDTTSWQIVKKFTGHIGPIQDLVFTPDGATILTAGQDGTLRVWSINE